jgi:hypothetical protein
MPTTGAAADAAAFLAPGAPGAAVPLILAGQPHFAPHHVPGDGTAPPPVMRAKEVLLALTAALGTARGTPTRCLNPHFMPIADWEPGTAVLHFAALEQTCPVPLVRNTLVIDGEDLLTLAEERRAEDPHGLHRRRALLMDRVLSAAPPGLPVAEVLPPAHVGAAPVATLLADAGPLLASAGAHPGQSGPVQWLNCDLQTGNYNFLELRRQPKLGTSHAKVLLQPAARDARPVLLGFATHGTLAELGPALRAFAAVRGTPDGPAARAECFIFFFGSPEAFSAALAARSHALFFGDNFRCPAIRFLFAPFGAPDVLDAIRSATCTLDSSYGGVLDALARGMGVPNRLVMGPDGRFDAVAGETALAAGIDWAQALAPATLARRRHKANRAGERDLAAVLERLLARPAAARDA